MSYNHTFIPFCWLMSVIFASPLWSKLIEELSLGSHQIANIAIRTNKLHEDAVIVHAKTMFTVNHFYENYEHQCRYGKRNGQQWIDGLVTPTLGCILHNKQIILMPSH